MITKHKTYIIASVFLMILVIFNNFYSLENIFVKANTSKSINIQSSGSITKIDYPNIMEKTIIWSDDSVETLTINSIGEIFLNGEKKIAFGLNIHTTPIENYNTTVMNLMLSTLENNGVRFMALDPGSWLTPEECVLFINFWLPYLYNHKMWVALYLQDDYNKIINYQPNLGNIFNVTESITRINTILQGITNSNYAKMIFSVGYNWELDNIGLTDLQVHEYLSNIYPLVKQSIGESIIGNVPAVGKNMQCASNVGTTAIVKFSDIPNYDLYLSTTGNWGQYIPLNSTWITMEGDWKKNFDSYVNFYLNYTMPEAGKNGMTIWFSEAGDYTSENSALEYQFTPEQFEYFYKNSYTSAIFLWLLQSESPSAYAAFDNNGKPNPWFENILIDFR